ncbi:MAG: hypothetical protein EOR73_09985 [Mesorhizobium sp.]|nr:MAG: hypothetical protein EOR73_09985 [Mesorhizobium sp.]
MSVVDRRLTALTKLADLAAASDDEGVRELAQAINEVCSGAEKSLDRRLGIRRRGGVSLARRTILGQRDLLLQTLWRNSPTWSDLAPSAAARVMVQVASRYQTNRWPRERHFIAAPVVEPDATWWKILNLGLPIPDAKRLQQILRQETQ